MAQSICVFCSSSNDVHEQFFEAARELGLGIGRRRGRLIFGGADVGLMRTLARAVHESGGQVMGVIPKLFERKGIAYQAADELIVTDDLRQRKSVMESNAEAFVALPGGFGTLDELVEMLALRLLRVHQKPVLVVNTAGFFDPLLEMFERLYDQRFAKAEHRDLCHVAADPEQALSVLDVELERQRERSR